MSEFETRRPGYGFTCTLWRGERMNLIGFDVAHPEPRSAGFSIKVKAPTPWTSRRWQSAVFSYPKGGKRGHR